MTWVAAGTAAVSIVGGLVSGSKARKAEEQAQKDRDRIQRQMAAFEANRQAVINPYADVTSNEDMIADMKDNLSNPYASLGVATQAAEIQMEQTDIALANTLDTLQASGASAGGATALAQAAKQSKKEVSANIEQQEAQNEKLRAQGEESLQAKEMQLTQMEMAESARVQNAEAQGKAFVYGAQESRDVATLDRMSGQESQARADMANAQTAQQAATGAMISGVSSAATGLLGSGAFAEGGSLNPPPPPPPSDRRLKTDIIKIGESPSGLNIYSFEYIDISFGEGTYSGVMSDEIPKEAVTKGNDGFDRVDYSQLDVEFKKI
jgi:hypothetical protein|tara:strand:+ start:1603 stop:2568 length:966 start_codon:yes stop_codon:yes gene_type:complete